MALVKLVCIPCAHTGGGRGAGRGRKWPEKRRRGGAKPSQRMMGTAAGSIRHWAELLPGGWCRDPKGMEKVVFCLSPLCILSCHRYLLSVHDEPDIELGGGGNCRELDKKMLPDLMNLTL